MKRYLLNFKFLLLTFSPLFVLSVYADNSNIKEVKICDDAAEWPPYAFYERNKGEIIKPEKIVGYSIDTINYMLDKHKISHSIDMLPWKRCLDYVKNYKDKYTLVLEFSMNPQRDKDYYMTKSFYQNTPAVFYNKKKFRNGLELNKLEDLKKYSACGLIGYNYGPLGYKPKEIDTGSRNIEQILQKVKNKRCDLFPNNLEIIAGFKHTIGIDVLGDPDISYQKLTTVKPPVYYHMGVSRENPQGKELLDLLNKEIDLMKTDPEYKKIEKKWL